ncbi:hypothetical protein EVAR_91497_1 [Eumeta japonica]|uniref:Uncharacterized protein n=1 Tax=Eumeta variegata TaxID=151549 RepID=A0A4C1VB23_EUMVA|nr:hypothetical protein EVAR_91497_1 [Eumeta japonica]
MSQLVPYHLLTGEHDELMFATMFDYRADDYNKPVRARTVTGLDPHRVVQFLRPRLRERRRSFHERAAGFPRGELTTGFSLSIFLLPSPCSLQQRFREVYRAVVKQSKINVGQMLARRRLPQRTPSPAADLPRHR